MQQYVKHVIGLHNNKGKAVAQSAGCNTSDEEYVAHNNNEARSEKHEKMMLDIYEMLKYTCKTLALLKDKLGLDDPMDSCKVKPKMACVCKSAITLNIF